MYHHENACRGYSLEVPHRGTSKKYPQHIFMMKYEKNNTSFDYKIVLVGAMNLIRALYILNQ